MRRWLIRVIWNLQKPTPLDSVVRKERKRDEVLDKFLMLITCGALGFILFVIVIL